MPSSADVVSQSGPLSLPESLTASSALSFLSALRKRPERSPTLVLQAGEYLLESGYLSSSRKLGDDLWPVLEQLGSAAVDCGRWDLAEICIERLGARFEGSARVGVLQGMLLEGKGEFGKALSLYDELLKKDETNLLVLKRRIGLLSSLPRTDPRGGPEKAIKALLEFIDTVYADTEAWQQLAALYAAEDMLPESLYALEELLVLSPQNAFFVLQYAETLYSAGTPAYTARAWREYLRVIEMFPQEAGSKSAESESNRRAGPWVRALWGLKLCATYFTNNSTTSTVTRRKGQDEAEIDESVAPPAKSEVEAIDALVTDLLLNKAYAAQAASGHAPPQHVKDAVRKVLAAR
ncbi:Inositol phosphatase SIW14 [Tilletia horrida]|uniref:ER membrane protein complex subunit 2 n=1 Tax=Tilletia horrida TaxID=155126 RepID=A0AAN6JU40_9BASI|nr:Inositol phosphatase SIW14 [Tilletia horrida]KAK0556876.1 Inositol phosphatase SIW14 [Tilletia horrida]KAK0563319.1 Inositol phosphatase SIW14 [Tilletia horrida]